MEKVAYEGGVARRIWNKFRNESVFAMYTPFFVCLASGKLDSETIRQCISQDIFFLKAFVQAYKRAEECADDDEDKIAINKLRKAVKDDLETRDIVLLNWGFEIPKESAPNNATCKYTDFLLATASGKVGGSPGKTKVAATPFEKTKVAAYTLGAMAPCMRLCAFLCNKIQAVLDPDDSIHIYKKWIDSYSYLNFEAFALRTEDVLDKLSVSLTSEELEIIENLYHQAMKLEVNFFSAQPIAQKTIVPLSRVHDPAEHRLTIFCDFDSSCTTIDTSALLAEIAIVTVPKTDLNGSETQLARMSSDELRRTWHGLSSQYTEECEKFIESITTSETVEFNYEVLCNALEQFSDFEKMANSRVVQSGVLKGLNLEDIKFAGERLKLQDGCKGFFQKIVQTENLKTDVHVLSYCWCGDLIRSAFSSGDLNVLNVHSNELACEKSISTGEIVRKVESPMEKLEAFNDILKGSNNDSKHLTVYIGGSVGDLLCLLKADVGIVIGSTSSLMRLGDQFGISFVPLFSGVVKKQREVVEGGSSNWKGLSGILYTVSSWAEIHAFILGS